MHRSVTPISRRPRNEQLRGRVYARRGLTHDASRIISRQRGYVFTLEIRDGNAQDEGTITASYVYLTTWFHGSRDEPGRSDTARRRGIHSTRKIRRVFLMFLSASCNEISPNGRGGVGVTGIRGHYEPWDFSWPFHRLQICGHICMGVNYFVWQWKYQMEIHGGDSLYETISRSCYFFFTFVKSPRALFY